MSIFVVHPFQGHLLHKFVLKTFNIYRIFLCFTAFYNVSVLAIFNITEAYVRNLTLHALKYLYHSFSRCIFQMFKKNLRYILLLKNFHLKVTRNDAKHPLQQDTFHDTFGNVTKSY